MTVILNRVELFWYFMMKLLTLLLNITYNHDPKEGK